MTRVLLVACPESYRSALPKDARVRTQGDETTPQSDTPDLVVIGPDTNEPTVAAQRAARAYPGVDVLIATHSAELERLQSLLRITPFIPLRTALVCCEPQSELEQQIRSAVKRCDFRRGHRRLLASVQAVMAAPPPRADATGTDPVRDVKERRRLIRFFDFYESVRSEVAAYVVRKTIGVRTPPNPLRPQGAELAVPSDSELYELERAAVVQGDWKPYLAQLREVGRAHADLGVGFGAWVELEHAFREALVQHLVERTWQSEELLDIIGGMESFLVATLREIAGAHGNEQRARLEGLAKNVGIFAALVESSEDAIFTTTTDGVVTAQNDAAARLVGEPSLVGSNIARLAVNGSELTECLTRASMGTGTRAVEMAWHAQQGRLLQISLSVSAVLDEMRRVVGLSVIARDITEKKAVEASLRQSHKMEALGRLAGGIAHDFNNLLTIILGHATFLQTPVADPVAFSEDVAEIVDASQRARTLTAQLLTFSRKQPMQPRSIDLRAAVHATHQLLHRTLPPTIDIVVEAAGPVWPVRMDAGHVDQLLMNLALNARDAMPSGGQLRIEIQNDVLAAPTIVLPAGDYVLLAVHDTGEGIPPDLLGVVFDPFFTTKSPGRGTGIGLATCYSIVQQAHGDIQVSSEVGKGTSFRVWLPRGDAAAAVSKRPSDPSRLSGEERVLLVEDDAAVRATTARALTDYGYRVTQASDGEQALGMLAEMTDGVDLVVSDVLMPRISGLELATRMRVQYQHIPVLFITGYADESTLDHAALPEDSRILLKPFLPHELARRVREVLDSAEKTT